MRQPAIDGFAFSNGAAVMEEYRKRGIYSSLIRESTRHMRDLGIDTVGTEAIVTTSGPILRKNSFKETGQGSVIFLFSPS